MILIMIRTVILYVLVLFVVRIMGKSELSKMSPFQLVVIFMLAELASIPIEATGISLINGITAIVTLLFLQVLLSLLSIKNEGFKNFINGKPSILIEKGEINEKELKELRISISDLMEQLRLGNSPSIADVEYAVLESNGNLSIIPTPGKRPLTPDDIQLTTHADDMPLVVISDGILYNENLFKMGYTEKHLYKLLHAYNIEKCEDVFMAFCDAKRKLHIYMRENDKVKEVTS